MSLSLTIIPLAAALFAAKQSAGEGRSSVTYTPDSTHVHVRTRMSDPALLSAAIQDLDLPYQRENANKLTVITRYGDITMVHDGSSGNWSAHFSSGWTRTEADSFIADLDRAYGLRVQDSVLRKLHNRAPELGMRVEEQNSDNSQHVTLILTNDRRIEMSVDNRGTVQAETVGFSGRACLSQIPVLEDLVDGRTAESSFTSAYFLQEQVNTQETSIAARQY